MSPHRKPPELRNAWWGSDLFLDADFDDDTPAIDALANEVARTGTIKCEPIGELSWWGKRAS